MERLADLVSGLEAAIEFGEDVDIDAPSPGMSSDLLNGIERLVSSYEIGRILREDARRPCGKAECRQIVADERLAWDGTRHRDARPRDNQGPPPSESLTIEGVAVRLIDTAGARALPANRAVRLKGSGGRKKPLPRRT